MTSNEVAALFAACRNDDGTCWECDLDEWTCECGREMRGCGWTPLPAERPKVSEVVLVSMCDKVTGARRTTVALHYHDSGRYELLEDIIQKRKVRPNEVVSARMAMPLPWNGDHEGA